MPRVPTLGSRLTRPEDDDPARRLGRAGLDALMRDPRYMDGDHPEHPGVLDAVRRGFELVFDPPAPGRRLEEATGATRRPAARPPFATPPIVPDTGARPDGLPFMLDLPRNPPVTDHNGPFGRHFVRLVQDPRQVEILPTALREALGRRVLLAALAEDGRPLPKGFESDDAPVKASARQTAQAREAADEPRSATTATGGLAEKDWQAMIDRMLEREGLFNAGDPSMRGIKQETLATVLKREGLKVDDRQLTDWLKTLSESEAREIYRETIVEESQLRRLPDRDLAEQVFDGVVNQGQPTGIKQLQTALNKVIGAGLEIDGALGSKTQAAVEKAIADGKLNDLRRQIVEERISFIDKLKRSEREKEALRRRTRSFLSKE